MDAFKTWDEKNVLYSIGNREALLILIFVLRKRLLKVF